MADEKKPMANPETRETSNVNSKLKESFKSGNEKRAATKQLSSRAGTVASWVLMCMFGLGLLLNFSNISKYFKEELFTSSSTTSAPPAAPAYGARGSVAERNMTWKQVSPDGTLPVGVWSETLRIPIGCGAFYDNGNGHTYKVRTRRNVNAEWEEHTPGSSNLASQVQFMILEPGRGMTTAPVSIKCQ